MSNGSSNDVLNQPMMDALSIRMLTLMQSKNVAPGLLDNSKVKAWFAKRGWTTIVDAFTSAGLYESWNNCAQIDQLQSQGYFTSSPNSAACYQQYQDQLDVWAVDQYLIDASLNPNDPAFNVQQGKLRAGSLRKPGSSSDATLDKKDDAAGVSTGTVVAIAAGVVAVAGIGYYAWSQSHKKTRNPARAKLQSEKDTASVEKQVRRLAKRYAPRADQIFPAFEHGHWWVTVSPDPDDPSDRNSTATFSVVDTSSGLDLERV